MYFSYFKIYFMCPLAKLSIVIPITTDESNPTHINNNELSLDLLALILLDIYASINWIVESELIILFIHSMHWIASSSAAAAITLLISLIFIQSIGCSISSILRFWICLLSTLRQAFIFISNKYFRYNSLLFTASLW